MRTFFHCDRAASIDVLFCFFAHLLFSSKFLLFAFFEQNAGDFAKMGLILKPKIKRLKFF
jgi:hypothetical protein